MNIQFHGQAKSNYDRKVRAICSQYRQFDGSMHTLKDSIKQDITKIKRVNTSVASACYSVNVVNEFEPTEHVEVWNEVFVGKERLIVTITK